VALGWAGILIISPVFTTTFPGWLRSSQATRKEKREKGLRRIEAHPSLRATYGKLDVVIISQRYSLEQELLR